jgi:predicted Zn-dependent peptidase
MHHETQNDLTQSTANNLMYYNRRVHTKELAERVACVTAEDLKEVAGRVHKGVNVLRDLLRTYTCVCGGTSRNTC